MHSYMQRRKHELHYTSALRELNLMRQIGSAIATTHMHIRLLIIVFTVHGQIWGWGFWGCNPPPHPPHGGNLHVVNCVIVYKCVHVCVHMCVCFVCVCVCVCQSYSIECSVIDVQEH